MSSQEKELFLTTEYQVEKQHYQQTETQKLQDIEGMKI